METTPLESNISSPNASSPYPTNLMEAMPLMSMFTVTILFAPLAYFIYNDYTGYKSLGPAGITSNPIGYMKVSFLRLFTFGDPCSPQPVPLEYRNTGYLKKEQIPMRNASRPNVMGIIPHRQTTQRPHIGLFNYLSKSIENLAKDHPDRLRAGVSALEPHSPGLFSLKKLDPNHHGEVCHIHLIDGSMHLSLHPEDVKTVLDSGWGERHPLAKGGWWCNKFVPQWFVMVYAPRSKEDVEIIMEIVRAGISWTRGEKFITNSDEQGSTY